jgi:hypothetical protein
MPMSERRIMPRFKIHTPLAFNRMKPLFENEQQARRVTGVKAIGRRFTGRVTHIECEGMPQGLSRIGVLFLYYELLTSAGSTSSVGSNAC